MFARGRGCKDLYRVTWGLELCWKSSLGEEGNKRECLKWGVSCLFEAIWRGGLLFPLAEEMPKWNAQL